MNEACLVLRLAGPLQSWGSASEYNRRETDDRPTKSGIIGLLAAALGRRRADPIEDLVDLQLGVRVDQPGSLLRDYHTVRTLDGSPLLSASTNAKGGQKTTSPKKFTHVTTRFYLQDAVFVAAVGGHYEFLRTVEHAVRRPAFPLALGRRACVPTQPLVVAYSDEEPLWPGTPREVLLHGVSWQACSSWKRRSSGYYRAPLTVDDPRGTDSRADVPRSFDPQLRGMSTRRVTQDWADLSDGTDQGTKDVAHDPFLLLGW